MLETLSKINIAGMADRLNSILENLDAPSARST